MTRTPRKAKPARTPPMIDLEAKEIVVDSVRDDAGSVPVPDEAADEAIATPEEPASGIPAAEAASEIVESEKVESRLEEPGIEAKAPAEPVTPEAASRQEAAKPRDDASIPASPVAAKAGSSGSWLVSGITGAVMGAAASGAMLFLAPVTPDSTKRIDTLEQRLNVAAQPPAGLEATDKRLAALEQKFSMPSAAPVIPEELGKRLAALESANGRLATLLQEERARGAALQGEVQAAAETIQTLRANVEQLAANPTPGVDPAMLSELNARIATLESTLASAPSASAAQALAALVQADRLETTFVTGRPYADILGSLENSGLSAEAMDALKVFAQTGAPTPSSLLKDYAPVSDTLLRLPQSAEEGSWTDALWNAANRMVPIRPTEDPGGSSLPALVVRIEKALERGDVQAAAKSFAELPEPARAVAAEWGQRLARMAAASGAVRNVAANAAEAYRAAAAQKR